MLCALAYGSAPIYLGSSTPLGHLDRTFLRKFIGCRFSIEAGRNPFWRDSVFPPLHHRFAGASERRWRGGSSAGDPRNARLHMSSLVIGLAFIAIFSPEASCQRRAKDPLAEKVLPWGVPTQRESWAAPASYRALTANSPT